MTRTDAAGEVAALADLSREELIARWAALHGKAPPRAITRDLLLRGLAYSLQERAHGGLSAREARDLMALAQGKRPLGPKTEIADREGIDKPKVTRLLRLAFLSPRLERQIRDGEQPVAVTVKTLTRQHGLPLLWEEQEALVAFFR